jgi:hypothetical protein
MRFRHRQAAAPEQPSRAWNISVNGFVAIGQKHSLKYCTPILMKVYNLSIDSSERQTNLYSHANNYVVTLENPIYDVSQIKLISARIPTPQLLSSATNKTFSVDGNVFTLNETNYANGYVLAEDLETILSPPDSNISLVVYDEETQTLNFSNIGTSNAFTLEFHSGTNGYQSSSSLVTTPHQLMGFSSQDFSSNANGEITSGFINLRGPNSLVLKLSAGSDEFSQDIYSSTPFYTGHILLDGSDFINFNGADDPFIHHFHSGPQKFIQDLRVEFFYMSHGRFIPYDFRNQEHILKFEITCSTDKLEGLPKVTESDLITTVLDEEESINIPEVKNVYRWKQEYTYITSIVMLGLFLTFIMKGRPRRRISG